MSSSVEVGRITVKVTPDTEGFRRKLQTDLRKIKETLSVDVDADTEGLRRKIKAATEGIKAHVEVDVDRSALGRLRDKLDGLNSTGGGFSGMRFGGGDLTTAAIAVGVLVAAAPAVGVLATGLAAIPGLIAAIGAPIGAMALGIEGVKAAAAQLQQPFEQLKATMSAATESQFGPVFEQLGQIFPTLSAKLPSVTQGVADLAAGFVNTVTSAGGLARIDGILGNISTALSAAAPGVSLFTNGFLGLAEQFSAKLPQISTWFNQLGTQFSAWVDKISNNGSLSAAFDGLGAVVDSLVQSLAPLFQKGIDFMADPDKIGALTATIEVIGSALSGIVSMSSGLFESIAQTGYAIRGIIEGISSAWESVKTATASAFASIASTVAGIGARVAAVWDGIKVAASTAWNAVVSAVQTAWQTITSAVSSGVEQVVSFVSSLPGRIASALSSLASTGAEAGRALVQGIVNGISGMIGSAIAKARELASSVAGAVKGFLGINSPSKLFTEYGEYTAQGLVDGIKSRMSEVEQAGKSLAQTVSDEFHSRLPDLAKKGFDLPVNFATANVSQFADDLGIGGGALSALAGAALDWGQGAVGGAIGRAAGNTYNFQVSNVDEAMAVQRNAQNREALGRTRR